MNEFHIALIGHRPNKLAGYDLSQPFYQKLHAKLVSIIDDAIKTHPDTTIWVHSGMALGADTVWGFAAKTAMENHPGIVKFYAEIPVMSQPNKWFKQVDKDRWQTLYNMAEQKSVYAEVYSPIVMQERNTGMIDHADVLIAIWDGSRGGTGNAVNYARKHNVPTTYFDPKEFK